MGFDTEARVRLFLLNFRKLFDQGSIKYEFNRKSSLYFRELGWTNTQAARYVREKLHISNYSEGPSEHHFKEDTTVTVFGMLLGSVELYVKISIDENHCGCMSFHPAERPMNYPLRGCTE
nr:MAG TPA: quorum-sensing regulator [Caudoviricetes sp.]